MPKLVGDKILDLELELAKNKVILKKFPDAYYTNDIPAGANYYSKQINKLYNKTVFDSSDYWLNLKLYYQLKFDYNEKEYTVDIQSTSNQSYTLLSTESKWVNPNGQDTKFVMKSDIKIMTIRFHDYLKDFKKHKVRDDVFNDCSLAILDFIKKHPKYKLNETNLEPRLKKLLVFN